MEGFSYPLETVLTIYKLYSLKNCPKQCINDSRKYVTNVRIYDYISFEPAFIILKGKHTHTSAEKNLKFLLRSNILRTTF